MEKTVPAIHGDLIVFVSNMASDVEDKKLKLSKGSVFPECKDPFT
jgi:hypothetical protein